MKKTTIWIVVILTVLISLVILMVLNPHVSDKDFDLMYRIGTGEKTYKDGRNEDINTIDFSFNDQTYLNLVNKTKLIIHSLDIVEGNQERVIFDVQDIQKNKSLNTNIEYMDRKDNCFSNVEIQFKNDSVYVWTGLSSNDKNDIALFFKGIPISDSK